MTPSRFSDLVSTLSRCRPPSNTHALRRMHQAVARPLPSQPASAPHLSNESLHALYEDLMTMEPATTWTSRTGSGLQVHNLSKEKCQVLDSVLDATSSPSDVPSTTVDTLLAEYAKQGSIRDFDSFITHVSTPPTEHQRDLHVKAHIVNASLSPSSSSLPTAQRFPTSALAVLHQYEANGHFAPIKSYTRVISALFNVQTSPSLDPGLGRAAAQAQAWDLFAHMRYVAHPVPDAHLYALMIRACGSFARPEPERALDLWAEMQENGIEPTKGAYEAVIRVCGRSGQEWLGEGMRLAREMGDRYSITGMSGRGLWCGLLEGCKRVGDLKKARWILAEAVRGSDDSASNEGSMLDAELMTHVFHTYASYKPPFRRETTRLVDRSAQSIGESPANETQETSSDHDISSSVSAEDAETGDVFPDVPAGCAESAPSFSRLPPQTSSDVLAETRALFGRILQDRSLSVDRTHSFLQSGLLEGRFAHVELTPVLLNAYLSVFYNHASIEASREAFDFLFSRGELSSELVFHPDEHTYINALERCAVAHMEERHIALRWAEIIWQRWEVTEEKGLREGKGTVGSFARLIEKAHSAMRRVLILSGDIDGALSLLRSFVARYPPNAIFQPTDSQVALPNVSATDVKSPASTSMPIRLFAKPPILSTRTVLSNSAPSTARPLVRLTSSVSPKDDRVPPIIAFSDVDLLHSRLVEHGRVKDIGYIKWVCMAYSGALKKRRNAVLEAVPKSPVE